jgi:hypothetical protein
MLQKCNVTWSTFDNRRILFDTWVHAFGHEKQNGFLKYLKITTVKIIEIWTKLGYGE